MLVSMSNKELHRLPVIQAVVEKRLRHRILTLIREK